MLHDDIHWMTHAIELARRGGRDVRPNPQVGCVVVGSVGEVLGVGWHQQFGGPHAEVNALEGLTGMDLSQATAYVNLEPCSYHGKTPPCADLLIAAGVGTVVIGCLDPNPRVSGDGMQRLQQAGIAVRPGVMEVEARALNAGFLTRMTLGRPHVTLKLAQSLDGFVAPRAGSSQWITGDAARKRVHGMRAEVDAVITGSGTVVEDDPSLTVRHIEGPNPLRLVFDAKRRIPANARVLTDGGPTQVVSGPVDASGRIDLRAALEGLPEEVLYVLVESGPTLASAFLAAGLVDTLHMFTAPLLLGGGKPSFLDPARETLEHALRAKDVHYEQVGADMLTTIVFRHP
ncbi:MAG: bifunctional diaminohydroxyphosphoribosylaminopyrimidine deaminase/5-amino-6-(5-phosphoribosylamino)uracil reductase RibD [Rhodothermales bacterium]|nr:bifunctional diaminohydroxyphosphoribosylaminopyrimidine deaminase/5-amino-6-(5-phosphoribosylamino)uracil reductase RibD [Rhodothermales bacterium]MBO6778993.1 bifunctional diaminohydroxyphosphoribosylaminopyrimidine deaminase/5-amino-6-(5-phosphoribosylamino)uracil reductase RibD [Rhodothermales bacterium]